ncbi:MAG: CRTAC1 family protein [Halobacteriaceae archaeon]
MRREAVVLAAVLLVGYSLYGGLFLAAGAAQSALAPSTSYPTDPMLAAENRSVGRAGTFDFAPAEAGFDYEYEVSATGGMMRTTNAGVYTADYDGDGWQDLLAVGGEHPVLFRNTGGSFVRSGALPPIAGEVRSALFLDHDGDGDQDLLFLADGRAPQLLENVGGAFEHADAFEDSLPLAWGATTADYDRDGCLDLFVYQYGNWTKRLPEGYGSGNYSVPVNEDNGNPDHLYRGTCGDFEHVNATAAGIRGARWTLAASFVDLTGDGLPDIHQANDINYDVLYVNQGDGTFRQVLLPERTNRNGMSSEVADVTRDGRLDVFVTNIFYPKWAMRQINAGLLLKARGNNLIANHGNGTFVMRGDQYGINVGGWGWAAVIADLDNDGDQDLFHTTRNMSFERRDVYFTDAEKRRLNSHEFYHYPVLYARAGQTFTGVSAQASGFPQLNSRGVARLDFDRDGRLDLAVATTGEYRLFENRMDRGRAVQVRVLGPGGSPAGALGATVTVAAPTLPNGSVERRVHARTDFLSQDSRLVHVGVGNASTVDVTVRWPDGTERTFRDVAVGGRVVVSPDGVETRYDFGD